MTVGEAVHEPGCFEIDKDGVVVGCAGAGEDAGDPHFEGVGTGEVEGLGGGGDQGGARLEAALGGEVGTEDAVAKAKEERTPGQGEAAAGKVVEIGADDGGTLGVVAEVERDDLCEAGLGGLEGLAAGERRRRGEPEVQGGENQIEGAGAGAEYERGGKGALVEFRLGLAQEDAEDEGECDEEGKSGDEECGLRGVAAQVTEGEDEGRTGEAHAGWRSGKWIWKGMAAARSGSWVTRMSAAPEDWTWSWRSVMT
jgi:hypothetical protein